MSNKSRRIAVLSNTSWSIFNFRYGLLKSLLDSGVKVVIVAPRDEYSQRLENMGCEFEPTPLKNYSTNPFWDLLYTIQLFRILRRKKINFVISYTIKPNIYGSLACRLLNIPNLAVVTGLGHLFTQINWKTEVAKILYRLSLQYSHQVWFLNREDRQAFIRLSIVPEQKTFILPSEGVDTSYFRKNQFAGRSPDFNFLFAGRLMEEKGIHDFVLAAQLVKERYPHINFIILGFLGEGYPHAISKGQLLQWEKEGWIQFRGATSNIKKHLETVDCVVLPSYYREGVPRILLEAASMEIPIITTDNVGCREVIQHGDNGFVCKPRDAESLAYWMTTMINMPIKKREEMGERGRSLVVKKFKEQFIINQYFLTLENALQAKLSVKVKKEKRFSIARSFPIHDKTRSFGRKRSVKK